MNKFKLPKNNPFIYSLNKLHPFSIFYGTKYNKYVTYELKGLFLPSCLHVVEYGYSALEDFPKFASQTNYCIIPPNYIKSEYD